VKEEIPLITGAAGNIGSATLEYLAKEGMKVIVTDIDDAKGLKLVDGILSEGREAKYSL
jgi:NAD(P)-dependent dehydrogenase (short-subunit alcohol dehydrogenase family)